ncbi:effector-associated constant component EACC1 [Micromonospora sp. NBC_01796]|uniref:effector-associated constant component EACC1 n=1 Tax=Micromonospora sp. NBC_01796 TaxID=2975987 RepID=UPI002DDA212E|nr:hypothetical protein [Micromonospora sp. NBC_01796]WSA85187.1 hypothetical protein OIE47_33320 [Micromonospora sp. NBC_01796]
MSTPALVTISGIDNVSADDFRSLRLWLLDADELPGPVELRQQEPAPGELGGVTDAVVVALGSGGAGALLSAVVSWIRHRTTDLTIKIDHSDGTSIELTADRLRGTDITQLGAEIDRLTHRLTPTDAAAPSAVEPTREPDRTTR